MAESNLEHKKPELENPTFYQSVINFCKFITIEPVVFFYIFSTSFAAVAGQTLSLQKACRVNLDLGNEICESLRLQNHSNNFTAYERMVQEYVAAQVAWTMPLKTICPFILLIFFGGWSDKTGRRKIILTIPVFGSILSGISTIINVIFFDYLHLQVQLFFNIFFTELSGGSTVMVLAVLNYICHITTIENRTHRIGIVSLFTFVSTPLGIGLSGIVFTQFGYYTIYITCLVLDLITLVYIICRVSDPFRSEEQKMLDGQGFVKFLRTFFDLTTIRDTFRLVSKKTPNNRRIYLCVLLVLAILIYGPIYGEGSVMYMSTRYRFNWDEVRFTIFQTYNNIVTGVGTIFCVIIFSKILKFHDSILGVISGISKIAASFIFCFAPNEQIFFIGPAVDLFSTTGLLAIKAMYSKLLDSTEIGKFNSIIGMIENITPLLYVPLFVKIYTLTMDLLPGAVFLLGAVMVAPIIIGFGYIFFKHKRDMKKEKTYRYTISNSRLHSTHI